MTPVRAAGSLIGARGVHLVTRSWRPEPGQPSPVAVVVIVHGFGEHCGRYDWVAERLTERGYVVYACDHRGHGRSEGDRAVIALDEVVADVDGLVSIAAGRHPELPVFMLGHSLGGMIALRYALVHQARLTGLILSGALAALEAPAAARAPVRLMASIAPRTGLIALDPELVSRDPAVVAAYRADPLVHHGRIPALTLAEMLGAVASFPDSVGAITVPTLIAYGTADRLCPPAGSEMLARRLGADDLTVRPYEGLYHEIFNEPERATVIADVLGWLDAHVASRAVSG